MSTYEWRYDSINKTGYLKLTDKPITSTIELTEGIYLDKDVNNEIVGVEILK